MHLNLKIPKIKNLCNSLGQYPYCRPSQLKVSTWQRWDSIFKSSNPYKGRYVDTPSFERPTIGEKRVSSTSAGRLSWARQPDNNNNTIERGPNILSEGGWSSLQLANASQASYEKFNAQASPRLICLGSDLGSRTQNWWPLAHTTLCLSQASQCLELLVKWT